MPRLSPRAIERLIEYRRALLGLATGVPESIFSHELAALVQVKPVQVRRDLMVVGFSGSSRHGYRVQALARKIDRILDAPGGQKVALVGVGNMGRALLSYLSGRSAKIALVAAFDNNPEKVGRVIAGCRCYDVDELADRVKELGIKVGILTVPGPQAQAAADALAEAGVTGILNLAPVPLSTRPGVHVEQVDIMRALEKAAHFAKQQQVRED
jgi:redox-sensing transcriptional repressor